VKVTLLYKLENYPKRYEALIYHRVDDKFLVMVVLFPIPYGGIGEMRITETLDSALEIALTWDRP
jgi:hypothetical protein